MCNQYVLTPERSVSIPRRIALGIDVGQTVLDTDHITESLQGNPGKIKIPELLRAVQGSGVKYDVIVNVCFIGMCCYDKGMFSLSKPQGSFVTDTVCFLGCDLARLKGLADLISNNVIGLIFQTTNPGPAGLLLVFSFYNKR